MPRKLDRGELLRFVIGYEFPYLLISLMIQSPSYTKTIYKVLFLPAEPDDIFIGWL